MPVMSHAMRRVELSSSTTRIVPAQHSTAPYSCGLLRPWEGKKECRSFRVIAYDPHMPMMSLSRFLATESRCLCRERHLSTPVTGRTFKYPFPVFDPNRRSEVMYGNENLAMTRSCGISIGVPPSNTPRVVDVLRQNHGKQSAIRAHGQ